MPAGRCADEESGNSIPRPRIVGVGTAVPPFSYSQSELLEFFKVTDPKIRSVFMNSAIERRHLTLPPVDAAGDRRDEAQGELLRKHRTTGLDMGMRALQACLKRADAELDDVRYLCCVSTTGFMTPGFSALIIKELGLRQDCARLDVVGMGCNAGLNGLGAVAGWSSTHPGELAVLLCVEACSAAYVFDGTMRSSVVNSLFGDGSGALALISGGPDRAPGGYGPGDSCPTVLKFASCIIPDAVDAMRYDWDDDAGKFSFFLDRDVPYVVGAHAESVVGRLLEGTGIRRSDIAHWIVHSGGKKVIDSVTVNLGLTRHDVRHTTGVLRDYGNLSSGSFLFSYARLLDEGVVEEGDYGIFMTMGPGSTIETALLRY
ncbi:type III polyketide synthase [Streptomyces cinnamoneus]|uniref:Type III polyketide synthase n=1 Tax=Streptomyces cinnamoneus TaxID=53446 RepID=A0A2G1XPZ7_STRCJ|nr:3,5-dihydroxyphenylacetyl-CoA synthase DpgA [Streptomyces cinnamoneus]PHQ53219.1 type III polyketide synthase [Streptomyces cinnamoneus]PPT12310.1 type III polyketide synthase [Streptomyces cinnamoneus]